MPHDETVDGGWLISDDRALFDLLRAHGWIARQSYWAENIPMETFRRAVENSLTVGVYAADGKMAAMARVVTDRATFGWLCDVFVESDHRGAGLGGRMLSYLRRHPELQGFRRMHLATRDAHAFYSQFGFVSLTEAERWMEIRDQEGHRP